MSHRFYEGEVFHKRFKDADHKFTYGFFMLDIDLSSLETLKTRFFSYNALNLFSFYAKDHFGDREDFLQNVCQLLEKFGTKPTEKMRFLTLPGIANFVFNPISVLVLFKNEEPEKLFVEVHNYNCGRIVYPVDLEKKSQTQYRGEVQKDMYVSPFLQREGLYKFTFTYANEKMTLGVTLYEDGEKMMMTTFSGKAKAFSDKSLLALLGRHTFLTLWVVTRTLWQTLKLYIKGLKFNQVTAADAFRRY